MPKLHWIGRDQVVQHHRDVPVRALDFQYRFTAPTEAQSNSYENRIIHGDNLDALKSLLPEFEGRVNCIYIDPPYNTGNEGWVYNDAMNDPKMKRWLGQVVGKEGEDLTRHDKWLCMMYPRLKLLHRLLKDDGVIFVSIDDNEQAHLKLVMDEIFSGQFVANVLWQKRTSPDVRLQLSDAHEHVLCYAKKLSALSLNKIPQSSKQLANYKNPDNDPRGRWVSSDYSAQGFRPNQMYDIHTPSGRIVAPPAGNCWKNTEDIFLALVADNRIWFGKNGDGVPRRKTFLAESEGITPWSWWGNDEVGHSQEAKKEIKDIFLDSEDVFDTPKPTRLIERILQIATNKNAIILDSFAGSGTTAHAVLKLNAQDGGKRRFILVETMDYAETITAERVRRVISGYGEGAKAVAGLGGGFDFYRVGERLFDELGHLNPAAPQADIRAYIAWQEGLRLDALTAPNPDQSPYWLGTAHDSARYFCYEPNAVVTLDFELLASLKINSQRSVIYADVCTLGPQFMAQRKITFKKIPRDIAKL